MSTYETESRGEGWVLFAGIMILIAGFLNFIWGIAAIDGASFFTDEGRYVIFTDLNTWGWFFLIVGVLQLIAAFSIWNRHAYGRCVRGPRRERELVILLFTVNAFPFAALMVLIIDILVIYGLVAYGGRQRTAT